MTTNEQIFIIANQLANQGKKPTVALVKTKLTEPTPLPVIIKTLKVWQHEPDFVAPAKGNNELTNEYKALNSDQAQLQQLIDQAVNDKITELITPLQREIDELKVVISGLSKSLK
ncbi:hypothetical protein J7384_00735 [Endozoicomonas sp. G2_1]|uniref:hypothetical protein n=1 Tax=Endozoicomonas sp. G2_1 TaxID=2821091 RepID=UPI001AD97F1F|nr:hypothetical protein [Endozoicomonas sp. G2_1]MBO9488881.1 hypothetical protein [Endozoicomonas sp. G2_1]